MDILIRHPPHFVNLQAFDEAFHPASSSSALAGPPGRWSTRLGFLSAPAMALGERPARPRFVSGPRRGPSTARRLFQCSPPPPSSEPPPREAAPGWSSFHFLEAGYQFCRFLSPPVLSMKAMASFFIPLLRVRARPIWRSPGVYILPWRLYFFPPPFSKISIFSPTIFQKRHK